MADPSESTQVSHGPVEPDAVELVGAVRSLTSQVEGLQAEVQALRHETRVLPSENGEHTGWDEGRPAVRESPSWVRSVDTPHTRGLAVPWLLVEILFLVAVAALAAAARLDAPVIAGVMVGAWILVAVAEWAAERRSMREHALVYGTSIQQSGLPDDPSWLATSGADTLMDVAADDRTAPRLPPPQPE